MAVNINTVYEYVRFLTTKDLGSGYLSPDDFNAASAIATQTLFNKYSGIFQNTQTVTEKIRSLIKKTHLDADEFGVVAYPSDYVRGIAIRGYDPDELAAAVENCDDDNPPEYGKVAQIKIKVIDSDKLGDRLTSRILKPSKYRPIATYYEEGIQIHPIDLGSIILEYLRLPATPIWGFTIGSNGLEEYNAATSTNFDFEWFTQNEIICMVCSLFGISVRESDLVQYADLVERKNSTGINA